MLATALFLVLAGPTPPPPPRSAADQIHLTALAEALGSAHALHRLCTGPEDDHWRARMGRMLTAEHPDAVLKQRLTDAFNAGFATGGANFHACSPQSRSALADVERRAADEARALGGGGAHR